MDAAGPWAPDIVRSDPLVHQDQRSVGEHVWWPYVADARPAGDMEQLGSCCSGIQKESCILEQRVDMETPVRAVHLLPDK